MHSIVGASGVIARQTAIMENLCKNVMKAIYVPGKLVNIVAK